MTEPACSSSSQICSRTLCIAPSSGVPDSCFNARPKHRPDGHRRRSRASFQRLRKAALMLVSGCRTASDGVRTWPNRGVADRFFQFGGELEAWLRRENGGETREGKIKRISARRRTAAMFLSAHHFFGRLTVSAAPQRETEPSFRCTEALVCAAHPRNTLAIHWTRAYPGGSWKRRTGLSRGWGAYGVSRAVPPPARSSPS